MTTTKRGKAAKTMIWSWNTNRATKTPPLPTKMTTPSQRFSFATICAAPNDLFVGWRAIQRSEQWTSPNKDGEWRNNSHNVSVTARTKRSFLTAQCGIFAKRRTAAPPCTTCRRMIHNVEHERWRCHFLRATRTKCSKRIRVISMILLNEMILVIVVGFVCTVVLINGTIISKLISSLRIKFKVAHRDF